MALESRAAELIEIRPLTASDASEIARGFGRLSAKSRHLRWGLPVVDAGRVLQWVDLLGDGRHFALGACTKLGREPVGVARYVRDAESGEIAVTIVDAWQGRGVGSLLLHDLFADARARGLRSLRATVFAENKGAGRLARRFGGRLTSGTARDMLEYDIPVADMAVGGVDHGQNFAPRLHKRK